MLNFFIVLGIFLIISVAFTVYNCFDNSSPIYPWIKAAQTTASKTSIPWPIKDVIIPCLSVVSFSTLLCMIPFFFIESCVLRLISTGVVYIIMFIFLSYLWAFNKNQKAMFKSWIQNVMAKFTF